MGKQKLGRPGEIGNHGDFVIMRKVIITENGKYREFYLSDGTFLGRIKAEERGRAQGTFYEETNRRLEKLEEKQ